MSTTLSIISNIKTSKEEVVRNKDIYLKQLNALNLEPTYCTDKNGKKLMDKGDWVYEFDEDIYDKETLKELNSKELIYYISPFEFDVSLFNNCLLIDTIYKYVFMYECAREYINTRFRKDLLKIVSIFGGTEVIFLADNCCDKIGTYLECYIQEGVSYEDVKAMMKKDKIPFVNDFNRLDPNKLSYTNITEYLYDDFSDLINKPK